MELDTIYNMDCIEGMKMLPDKSIDMIITSPPYDNLREYNKSSTWNFEIFKKIAVELFRVLTIGGVMVWIVADGVIDGSESGSSFRQALFFKDCGFRLHDTMIWEKDSFSFPDSTRYRSCFEYMFVFSKGKPKTINLIADRPNKYAGTKVHGTSRSRDGTTFRKSNDQKSLVKDVGVRFNVWCIPSEKKNKTGHPAMFPERLITDHIVSWSDEGQVILDPFLGSGTTAVAAYKNNRHYIGYEIDEVYFDAACRRLDDAERERENNNLSV